MIAKVGKSMKFMNHQFQNKHLNFLDLGKPETKTKIFIRRMKMKITKEQMKTPHTLIGTGQGLGADQAST